MKNKTKAKLKRGEIPVGHFVLEFATPGIGQMAANAGCDYLIFDMEHSSFTQESIRLMTKIGIMLWAKQPGKFSSWMSG